MGRLAATLIALLLALTAASSVRAAGEPGAAAAAPCAEGAVAADCIKALQQQLAESADRQRDLEAIIRQLNANLAAERAPVGKKYQDSLMAFYDYQAAFMRYGAHLYAWELWVSSLVLGLVAIIVFAGLSFSGYQLWKAVTVAGVQTTAEMELSAGKLRVTSSVVGIVVLLISLAFFYLFIVEVYPIKGALPEAPAKASRTPAAGAS